MASILLENNINNLLQISFEVVVEQLVLLNNKIEKLEKKIDYINNYNYIKNTNINNCIDWDSVHLY